MSGFSFFNLTRKHRSPGCDRKSSPCPFQLPEWTDKDPALHVTSFPISLPIDLGRYVIEMAAHHDLRTACQLLLVSRQVHEWVKPVLYSCISANSEYASTKVMRAALEQNAPEILRLHVKTFGIHFGEAEEAALLLQICVNIKHLAIWTSWDRYFGQIKFQVQNLRPSTVTLKLVPIFGAMPDFRHPFFGNVSHLVIYDAPYFWTKWDSLHLMPSLTHLALRFYSFSPSAFAYLRVLLKKRTKLEQIIVFTGSDVKAATAGFDKELLGDARLLLARLPDEHRDWEDFATGGTSNVWAHAKRKALLKKRMQDRLRQELA